MKLSALHVSDLHRDPASPLSNSVLLDSLKRDRDRYTSSEDTTIRPPDFIIVSGDIIQGVDHEDSEAESNLQKQYEEACDFLNNLTEHFVGGEKKRVIIVPGNHDVSGYHFRKSLEHVDIVPEAKTELVNELFTPNSLLRWSWQELALYKVADLEMYKQRFAPFNDFYSNFYEGRRSYSIEPREQFDIFEFTDWGFTVAGFCSCYNNDLFNRQGIISSDCIAGASEQLRSIPNRGWLRIAVWHHHIEGPPSQVDYMDPDIVQNLIDGGFSLAFHGHQHKPQFLNTRFRHGSDRRITVIGAGTLCGNAALRFGRSYNLVELDIERRVGRLYVREMQNDNLQMPIWGPRSMRPDSTSYWSSTLTHHRSHSFVLTTIRANLLKPYNSTTIASMSRRRGYFRRLLCPISWHVPSYSIVCSSSPTHLPLLLPSILLKAQQRQLH